MALYWPIRLPMPCTRRLLKLRLVVFLCSRFFGYCVFFPGLFSAAFDLSRLRVNLESVDCPFV